MRSCAEPRMARLGRAVRGLWPDGNPLRRTCDRFEAWMLAGLCAAFLIGGPLAAVFAADYAYDAGVRAEHTTSHRVAAILLATAQSWEDGGNRATAPVRWPAPGGETRIGRVPAPAGARAGSAVRVWVDGSGQLTGAPLQNSDVALEVAVAAILAPAGLGLLLLCAGVAARRVLERRRLAAWEADWQATEPGWTRQS